MDAKRETTGLTHDVSDLNYALEGDQKPVHSLLLRIDWRILPIMFLTYFLQFLDKVCLNYANVMGLQSDLGMSGNDFSWLATAFFIAYAVAEVPQGYLLQKFPITRVLGCNVFIWGVLLCCSAAAQNYGGLMALRVLLGITEAVVAPALTMYTSLWYTRRESTPRFGLWYCGVGVGQIIGGLVSFGAQHAPASLSLTGWRIMFLVIGLVNILAAALILVFLPLSLETARFLSADEKTTISARLKEDSANVSPKQFHVASLWVVLTDIQTWLLLLITILSTLPSGLIVAFSSMVIKNYGYTAKQSALLNMPSGAVSIVCIILSTYAIARGYPRWLALNILFIATLLGACLMSFMPQSNKAGCLVGIYLVNATVAPLGIIFAWIAGNFKGYTGKISGAALISAGFSVANIIGPQTFQARDAPDYIPAKVTIVAINAAAIVAAIALRVVYGMRNSKAEDLGLPARSSMEKRFTKDEEEDLYPGFRYVY